MTMVASKLTLNLLPHRPQVVLCVQELLPRVYRGFAGQISIIDSGQPGEEDHAAVAEDLVEEHLPSLIVTAHFDGF